MTKMFKQAVQVSLGLALIVFAAQEAHAGTRPPGSVRPPSTSVPVRPPNFGFIPTRGGGGCTAGCAGAPSAPRAFSALSSRSTRAGGPTYVRVTRPTVSR